MSAKRKAARKQSPFSRQFSALTKEFQALAGKEKAGAVRKKLYDLMTAAVLDKKSKLKSVEMDQLLGFMRDDVCRKDNEQIDRAVPILERLGEKGKVQALTILADFYSAYSSEPPVTYRKRSRAVLLYEKVARSGDMLFGGYAHSRLAQLHATSSQQAAARKHAEESAYDCKSPYGLVLLGCWYYDGQVVEKDWKKSHELLQHAYNIVKAPRWDDRGGVKWETYFHYGFILYHGQGCAPDRTLGMKLLRAAADNGNDPAREWLAKNDPAGTGTRENPMAAFAKKKKKNKKTPKTKKELDALLQPLHAMIGCAPVKREIESLIYLAHANALRAQKKIDSPPLNMHAAFLGAPGTGKTTVARLYGKLLHELGFLKQGHLVECTRADLVAEYIGQTAPKVRALVEKAIGGVLFIDEAYALLHDPDWDFGPEAIAELIQQMENRRDDLVVIFAGYTDKMKAFLKMNPGLKSRVPNTIEFPDYSVEEMVEIFVKFCTDAKFTVKPDALPRLAAHLRKLDRESIRRMGNARGIRNIFEDSLIRQARRVVREGKTSRKALTTLLAEDIHLPDDPGKGILTVIKGGGK
jgi:stage V sporulation protein K